MCQTRRLFPIKGELLEALKDGDELAWQRVVIQESPCLKAWFRRRLPAWLKKQQPEQLGGGGIVGDLVQDTWTIVMTGVIGNDEMQVLEHAFIHNAAQWAMIKRLKTESRRRDKAIGSAGLDDDDFLGAQEGEGAEAPASGLDEYLDAAGPPLTEFERTVVKIRLEEGLTFREIGEQLGKSLPTVTGAWYRAIAKIAAGICNVDYFD